VKAQRDGTKEVTKSVLFTKQNLCERRDLLSSEEVVDS
jgi:hypothetical protein